MGHALVAKDVEDYVASAPGHGAFTQTVRENITGLNEPALNLPYALFE